MITPFRALRLFDVTLCDNVNPMKIWYITPFALKKHQFKQIVHKNNPKNIEIGSLTLPHIVDIERMFRFSNSYIHDNQINTNLYMALPTKKNRFEIAHDLGVKNISVMAPDYVNTTTDRIINKVSESGKFESVKVYVSCSEVSLETGKVVTVDMIADNICKYVFCKGVSEVALYDAVGTLHKDHLINLIRELRNRKVQFSKIGVHFNRKIKSVPTNMHLLVGICIANGITNIDVSNITTITNKGCSLTIGDNDMYTNTQYDDLDAIEAAYERVKLNEELIINYH
jgi:hypothetical protein